jgi:[ribosomal protein S18]-alanine N-acetyltransferase
LRRLGALDLDLASRLHGEAFAPLGERVWTRQDMAELVASRGIAGVVLQVEDEAIGFAVWRIAADEAELLTIAVLPNWRRRGAGRKLLDAVIADAREARAHSLFLEVGTDNPPALALYGKAGFAAVGSRQAYYRRGERPAADAVVMRLALISGG